MNQIEFTKSQQEALDKLNSFLLSSDRFFLLTGKAGTGKTTIIRYALEKYLKKDRKVFSNTKRDMKIVPNVLGVALAHKAKNNLHEKGGIPFVNTFASAYGHQERFTNSGKRIFVPQKGKLATADCKKDIKVFVIDECSMFSQSMLDLVYKETTMFAKIIFMGDRGQLPPIEDSDNAPRDSDSPLFHQDFGCNQHELLERVRQTDGNPIIDLSDHVYQLIFKEEIRSNDLSKLFLRMHTPKRDDKGHGYDVTNYDDIYPLFKASSDDYLDTKVIAYTNRTINSFNRFLRGYIHNDPKEVFIPGEIIYMNSTYYGNNGIDEYAFYNSSEYIILDTDKGEMEGIGVMYAELEEGKSMPVVRKDDGGMHMEIYKSRIQEYKEMKQWREMYRFKDSFGDFSYGYALTAYKAQGSTYKTVFIDVNDMFGLRNISTKRKLQSLYTAITRASHNIYFIKA